MKILVFSTLFPNAESPHHGVFVETRLRNLLAGSGIKAHVVAPVPWFPFSSPRFGRYAAHACAPDKEVRHGIAVDHPRYPVIPKIGMLLAPRLLYLSARRRIDALIRGGLAFDLIDAHYAYPDGVAAALLGRHYGKPVVITARGTDISLIPQNKAARRQILWAANQSAAMISVCQALKDEMVAIGIPESHVTVLRNGVDLDSFHPADRGAARARLDLSGPVLASVGHLIERKAHDLVIGAMPDLPEATLLIVGEGPEEGALRRQADDLGVAARVRFLGRRAPSEMPEIYGAADVLVLASSREGWANVLLEAMACGTPVVASDVWGTPEVVTAREAGLLMGERTAKGVAEATRALLADPPDRAATRKYAEAFSWDATTQGQVALFGRVIAKAPDQ